MAKVLVIEDDFELNRKICDWLSFEKHLVEEANNGLLALSLLNSQIYDVAILDWDLPKLSGLNVLKQYRDSGGLTPILMLTGKSDLIYKEQGLDSGADDYLTKPFQLRELSARLRALIRRAEQAVRQCSSQSIKSVSSVRGISIDVSSHRVKRYAKDIELTAKEFALLHFFMSHQNQVFSSEALLKRVWPDNFEVGPEAITTCIKRLRKKLDLDSQNSIIKTVHGIGYRFDSETSDENLRP